MRYIVDCFDLQHANYAMYTVKKQVEKWKTIVKIFKKDRIIQVDDTIFFLAYRKVEYMGRHDWKRISVDEMYEIFDTYEKEIESKGDKDE